MQKLFVFGSARIDAFLELPDSLAGEACRLDTEDCFLELSYAAKLPLNRVTFCVGGNGANVAVGCKRLGIDISVVAELGCGPIADYAKKELGKEIDLALVTQTEGIKEGFGAVIVYHGERTILSYYSPGRPPFPDNLETAEWAYLTSVGENFEDFFDDFYVWLKKNKTRLAFNPGGRQMKKGRKWLGRYLEKTEVLLVNREEAEEIVGRSDTHGKEKELLNFVSATGPKSVIITDGANGAYAKENTNYYHIGILPVDAISRTGAGDAFSAGCLSALIKGKTLPEALIWGTVNSTSVIGYVGPQTGLLKESGMATWMDRARSSGVRVEKF